MLEGKSPVKPEYVRPLLKLVTHEEFESLITVRERLKAYQGTTALSTTAWHSRFSL